MTPIALRGLRKEYDTAVAVDHVDLEIEAGSLFFLLGPSGCGKTTLLRMIAGFIEPTAGRVLLGDRDVTSVPPNRRNTGMVFQSYALWPHLSVSENVAFGLKVRRQSREEITRRVGAALALVRMDGYGDRKPNQLSGGQQQRVALARALAFEPTVLLLDEPLSNLDAKLRLEMRSEIRRICKELGMTAVYVTHDQKEALSMADEMAVLRSGRIVQRGAPRVLYDRPTSPFVADFLGETNFLDGRVDAIDGAHLVVSTAVGSIRGVPAGTPPATGSDVVVSVRPESLEISGPTSPEWNTLDGTRGESTYLGEMAQHLIRCGDLELKVAELNPRHFGEAGEPIRLSFRVDETVVIDGARTTD